MLRRVHPPAPAVVDTPPVRIDTRTRDARVGGRRVTLSQKEYDLLLQLAREPDRVFTKAEPVIVGGCCPNSKQQTGVDSFKMAGAALIPFGLLRSQRIRGDSDSGSRRPLARTGNSGVYAVSSYMSVYSHAMTKVAEREE